MQHLHGILTRVICHPKLRPAPFLLLLAMVVGHSRLWLIIVGAIYIGLYLLLEISHLLLGQIYASKEADTYHDVLNHVQLILERVQDELKEQDTDIETKRTALKVAGVLIKTALENPSDAASLLEIIEAAAAKAAHNKKN